MYRQGQLNRAQVGPQVTTGSGNGFNQKLSNFGAELLELVAIKRTQICRTLDFLYMHRMIIGWPEYGSHYRLKIV